MNSAISRSRPAIEELQQGVKSVVAGLGAGALAELERIGRTNAGFPRLPHRATRVGEMRPPLRAPASPVAEHRAHDLEYDSGPETPCEDLKLKTR